MKKIISALLAFILIIGAASSAFAMSDGDYRVVFGADLTEAEREEVLGIFGLSGEELDENRVLTVTNAEERAYLNGKVPDNQIGTRSISSIYIKALPEGSGVTVSAHNINYCTADMYKSVLATVGITDAEIIVAAPRSVSGTAALTGIYKAYESLTGALISDYAKMAGVEELITTGKLAELIGSEQATEVITELKKILDITRTMSDDDVRAKIAEIAEQYNVELTEEHIRQILTLVRMLEGLDVEQIRARALGLVNAATGWQKFTEGVSQVFTDIAGFFKDVANFLRGIFDGLFTPNTAG
ncbi:MAG: DUF1002 domain-containing protein [Clostridia bacterium]|nr:DUF1002 domain-containing protein [Clostridia bacterium]MBR6007185.1 DUF1002 domain-containing protein [Clostridia bacterium]